AASLGQVAVPELRKRGFKPALAGAVAAAGGSLSSIIPPSIILILYGVATETPIGDLFVSAVIPGILVTMVFIAVMYFLYFRHLRKERETASALEQEVEEAEVEAPPVKRLILANSVGAIIVAVIFGGIYSGFVTPTEAGAVGAVAAFVAALILGKVNMTFLRNSLGETLKVTSMVMLILIGAQVFGRFVSLSLLPRQLINLFEPIMDSPKLVLFILLLVFFVLFMFIEGAAVILMTMPVLLPVIQAIQVDILWFGTFVAVIGTLGLLTPPVGLSVYATSASSGIPPGPIFKYAMIFALAAAVVVGGLMIFFPEIALWLPGTME
ncbi:MAG TPA: TRAP transporter large permease subunit, partial [Chondromyces sp.]|nr:TRAP transporter large permease subunit [Chondromyces sp.]